MTKFALGFFASFILLFIYSFYRKTPVRPDETPSSSEKRVTADNKELHGTWVNHSQHGFTLIEIKDASHITFYSFIDRNTHVDTITTDRYWYYKSNGTLGYWNNPTNPYKADVDIWISTRRARFDYRINGDTLMEVDKMGEQGKFIKVYEEK